MSIIINNQQPAQFFIDGVLRGDVAILSRAITLIESNKKEHKKLAQKIMEGILPHSGKSFRLGITGVPGVGKSTFIESFGKEVLAKGHKLAVLAIDPSSSKNKGSILGDKTRMEELSAMPNVYIRPSPSSGTLGGVAKASYDTVLLCEAAGFDFIIIETVGVGQSEITVSKITDFFLLLMLAGAGDELQGIKRGIMEMADSVVITKADGNNVDKARLAKSQIENSLHLLQMPESGFIPEVILCSNTESTGIAAVYSFIEKYKNFTVANNYFLKKRKFQQRELFQIHLEEQLKSKFYELPEVAQAMHDCEKNDNSLSLLKINELIDKIFKQL